METNTNHHANIHTTLVTPAKTFEWDGDGYFRVVCTCGVLGKNVVFAGEELAETEAAQHREFGTKLKSI
jgi:hypothetical protein